MGLPRARGGEGLGCKEASLWGGVTLGGAGPREAGGQEGGSVGWWGEDTYTSQGWPCCGGPGREKGSGVWVGRGRRWVQRQKEGDEHTIGAGLGETSGGEGAEGRKELRGGEMDASMGRGRAGGLGEREGG